MICIICKSWVMYLQPDTTVSRPVADAQTECVKTFLQMFVAYLLRCVLRAASVGMLPSRQVARQISLYVWRPCPTRPCVCWTHLGPCLAARRNTWDYSQPIRVDMRLRHTKSDKKNWDLSQPQELQPTTCKGYNWICAQSYQCLPVRRKSWRMHQGAQTFCISNVACFSRQGCDTAIWHP